MELPTPLDPIDARVTSWMARHGIAFTRMALGVVFLWFGIKNLVLVCAAIVVGATVRGGRLSAKQSP